MVGPSGIYVPMYEPEEPEPCYIITLPASPGMNILKTVANQTINAGAATFVDITGLTFPVVNGRDYAFYFYVVFRSAAAATGWKGSVNHPGGTVDHFADVQTIANNPAGLATWLHKHNVGTDEMTLLTATVTINVDLVFMIQGRYQCTANGTFAARFANELNANTDIVVQKGSWGFWF
jgi:ligand-binding SRPBCC domain-containing protein